MTCCAAAHPTHPTATGIGFCVGDVNLGRLPGWEPGSYGYHGDDGHAFHGSGMGHAYGPCFGAGDVIGALLNRGERTLSFFKNGTPIGTAFTGVTVRNVVCLSVCLSLLVSPSLLPLSPSPCLFIFHSPDPSPLAASSWLAAAILQCDLRCRETCCFAGHVTVSMCGHAHKRRGGARELWVGAICR